MDFTVARGRPDKLPAVAMVLRWLSYTFMEAGCKPTTIAAWLSGVNKAYVLNGLPPPGQHPSVARLMFAIRSEHRSAPVQKTPLTLDLLERVLIAMEDPARLEDAAILALTVAGVPAATQALLRTESIVVEGDLLTARVPDRGRWRTGERVVSLARRADALCPVEAVAVLIARRPEPGPLLRGTGREAMGYTRQGLARRAWRVLDRAAPGASPAELSRLSPLESSAVLARVLDRPLDVVRDRALFTVLWVSACRGANAEIALWGDIAGVPRVIDELRFNVRWSKTDQEGEGRDVTLLFTGRVTSPADALSEWRGRVALALGGDPVVVAPDAPMFTSLNSLHRASIGQDPTCLHPLCTTEVSRIVKSRTGRAKLAGDFSAHSLRAGLMTSAVDAEIHHLVICKMAGAADPRTVERYNRGDGQCRRALRQILT
jgi:integrase